MYKLPGTGNSQIELDFDNKYDNEPPIRWLVVKMTESTIVIEAPSEEEAVRIAEMTDDSEFEVIDVNMRSHGQW